MRRSGRLAIAVTALVGLTTVALFGYRGTMDGRDALAQEAVAATALSCDGLTAGQYVPDSGTTGVKAGSTLRRIDPPGGWLTISTAGTVLENADVYGGIKVRAANVTIRNTIVRGPNTTLTSSSSLITAWDAPVRNLLLEGVTLRPQAPSMHWSGINGHDYTARCVDVSHTTDGFGIYNTNAPTAPTGVRILQSYCHDLAMFSPNPGHADNLSHTDCVQAQGAKGIEIAYNYFSAMLSTTVGSQSYAGSPTRPADPNYTRNHPQALSAIMVNKLNVGGVLHQPSGWNVHHNRFGGGEVPINSGADDLRTNLGRMCENVFENNAYVAGQTMWFDADVTVDTCDQDPIRRNIFTTPITVRRNA